MVHLYYLQNRSISFKVDLMRCALLALLISGIAFACEKSTQGDVTLEICRADGMTHFFVSSQNPQTLAFLMFVRTKTDTGIRLFVAVDNYPQAGHVKTKLDSKIIHIEVHELQDANGVGFIEPENDTEATITSR